MRDRCGLILLVLASTLLSARAVRAQPARVVYPAGWNLIAAPPGTSVSVAPMRSLTMQPGDGYEILPADQELAAGDGVWAYFLARSSAALGAGSETAVTRDLPPGQWLLIGDPSGTWPARVVGADAVVSYDQVNGYRSTDLILPGSGAWVYSVNGAVVRIVPQGDVQVATVGAPSLIAGPPTVSVTLGGGACSGTSSALQIRVLDTFGHPVAGATARAAPDSGVMETLALPVTDAEGRSTLALPSSTVAGWTVVATAGGSSARGRAGCP